MKKKHYLFIIALSSILFSVYGNATVITFKAEGTDNIPANFNEGSSYVLNPNDPAANFFNITFNAGKWSESITKIIIDLGATNPNSQAIFDPSDGSIGSDLNGGGKGFGPVIGAETTGLSLTDVTFSLNETSGTSSKLEISFTPSSFTPGDNLSFGIDIDGLGIGLSHQAGGLLGAASVGLTTFLSGTCEEKVNSTFSKDSENRSLSEINICGGNTSTKLPEPNILFLVLMSLGMIPLFRKC